VAAGVNFKRGDLVLAASSGDYGKPRPNLVIQSDAFSDMPSVTVCPLSSDVQSGATLIRINIEPSAENGLHLTSQIAVDKITTLALSRVTKVLGKADNEVMQQVTRALAVFLELGRNVSI
jgi:mRNA interferase MazF